MIHTDCISLIGSSHKTCQDYSYADEDMIIVADGCSSSKDTDIGARILTHCAKRIARHQLLKSGIYSWWDFRCDIARAALITQKEMELDTTVMDATLIAAIRNGNRVIIYAYGDGTIVISGPTAGDLKIIDISFTTGAPYYLSYILHSMRMERYDQQFSTGRKMVTESNVWCGPEIMGAQDKIKITDENYDAPFVYTIDNMALGSKVAIFTDGVGSFINETGAGEPVLKYLIDDLLRFKNYNGEFVKRRVARVLKEHAAHGCRPYDDFSMAAMVLRPDEGIEDLLAKKEELAGV